jgi:diguanylate cyclase (GGDEF)-like protein
VNVKPPGQAKYPALGRSGRGAAPLQSLELPETVPLDVDTMLIGPSAALAACVVVLFLTLAELARRSSRRGEARVSGVVATLEARMDELANELAGAVARAEEETERSRLLGALGGTLDLDDVLARALDAASALPGADAVLVRLEPYESSGAGAKPIVTAVGISREDAERQAFPEPPDGNGTRAIELVYRHAADAGDVIRGGLSVALADEQGALGHIAVFTRDPGRRFSDDDVRRLEELAERAGPAIENARRFREARQLADLDALTGLHNRRYFHETLVREVARAHRYARQLSLVVLDLDDFKEINDRLGHLGGDAVLAEASERVREAVRSADVACRVGGDEFAVICPEAGRESALQLVVRIQHAVSSRPLAQAGRVRVSAGVAELQPEDDSLGLFERADEKLYAAKQARKGGGGLSAAENPA